MVVEGRVARLGDLAQAERDQLRALARLLPEGSDALFESELIEKGYVALVEDRRAGRIYGFCPLAVLDAVVDQRELRAILSGLTILDPDVADAETTLARCWLRFAVRQRSEFSSARLYWMLASAGRRRDGMVKRLFRRFVPARGEPVPHVEAAALRLLGQHAFGSAYDAARGTVRFEPPRHPAGASGERGVRAPAAARPSSGGSGFAPGEEIVYLARFTEANLTPLARRLLEPA